jgi:hypothetical protein
VSSSRSSLTPLYFSISEEAVPPSLHGLMIWRFLPLCTARAARSLSFSFFSYMVLIESCLLSLPQFSLFPCLWCLANYLNVLGWPWRLGLGFTVVSSLALSLSRSRSIFEVVGLVLCGSFSCN